MKLRHLLLIVLGLGLVLIGFAWYRGFIPIPGAEDRARLRDALNLNALPSGVTINACGADQRTTRYGFDADLSLSPTIFQKLLSGRSFSRLPWTEEGQVIRSSRTIDGHDSFITAEKWAWTMDPQNLQCGDLFMECTVSFNATHDRAFIQFSSE